MKAVHCEEEICVITLLERGTNPDLMDVYSNNALRYAIYNENTLLAEKLSSHHVNTEVLNKHGNTPLYSLQNTAKGGILVKKQANVHAVDRLGGTVLMPAVHYGSLGIVGILQQNITVFIQNMYVQTANNYAFLVL